MPAYMLKHRGFPGRLPGTDFQFTIRRPNPKGVTPITRRERRPDRRAARLFGGVVFAPQGNGPEN